MYSILRLLSLLALLSIIAGLVVQQMHWGDNTLLLVTGIICASIGFSGRKYLDYKKRKDISSGKQ